MYSRTVLLSEAGYKSDVVEDDHFEANAIYTRDYLDPGGPFDRMFADMGWSGLRFPGGTVTEENFAPGSGIVERLFDVSRPSGLSDDGAPRIVTTPAMFSYAIDKGIAVDFTLPTENYFSDETDEDGFRIPSTFGLYRILDRVDEMVRGDYGHAFIEKFEIGNEFWYKNERQTPEEYGHIVEHLASGMQSLLDLYQAEQADDSAWVMPEISVQSAPGWRPQDNEAIFDQLSLSSRAAIDAVSTHYYPSSYTVATDRQVHFDRLNDWQNLEGVDKELSYYVSEWNMATSTETDTGLAQASGMLETMRVMLERGIDHAAIWGTQYYNLRTRLAELENDPDAPGGKDYSLTPAGEIYRMMSSSIRGLRVLDLDTDSSLRDALDVPADERTADQTEQLVMHAYGGTDKTVIFISSRSGVDIDVTLDTGSLLTDYHHVWAERLGALDDPTTSDLDEGDPLSIYARPYVDILNESTLTATGDLTVTLQPYEIVKFEFSTGTTGVSISGHDQMVDPAADYDDDLHGSAFDDTLSGNIGGDILSGYAGSDALDGGEGNDTLFGGTGDDFLRSGDGTDSLWGEDGADVLIADTGMNDLRGDAGQDQFVVDPNGLTILHDLDIDAGEGLSFRNHYASASDVIDRTAVDGDDLLVSHDSGGSTRLVGLAARLSEFETVLTDFQADSPVDDIVAALNAPVPDGSIPPDPDPVVEEETAFTREDLYDLLSLEDPAEIGALVASLTPEEEAGLIDQVNGNALALSADQQTWASFCDNLSDAAFDRFIDGIDPEILDLRYLRTAADEYANGPDDLNDENGLPICRTFEEVSPEVRVAYYLALSPSELTQLEQYWADLNPDAEALTAAEILHVDLTDVDAEREAILSGESDPAFSIFLKPNSYSTDYLDEQEDEEDTAGAQGFQCFVATCVYGDGHHPDVEFLRLYRDEVLQTGAMGRLFVCFYYKYGPWAAALIKPFPAVKTLIRSCLARWVASRRAGLSEAIRVK